MAVSYLDRFLAKRAFDRVIFKAAAVTALCLAIKVQGPATASEPGTSQVLPKLLRNVGELFTVEYIATVEREMLVALGWELHPPTPAAFCRDFLRLVPVVVSPVVRQEMSDHAEFLSELSVGDGWFVARRPSAVALAAVLDAFERHRPENADSSCRVRFLERVAKAGVDLPEDSEIDDCHARLRYHLGECFYVTDDDEVDCARGAGCP